MDRIAAIALGVYLLFPVLAGVWRGWVQYRRTGDHGLRGVSASSGLIEWAGGSLLVLGGLVGLGALLAELAGAAERFRLILPDAIRPAGIVLMALGVLVTLIAQVEMGSSWRVGVDPTEQTELVTRGLFRWVRNPIFSAMLMVFFGVLLAAPNALAVAAFVLSLVGIEVQVRGVEEPYLTRVHGERYVSYAQRVGRFMPGIGKGAGGAKS